MTLSLARKETLENQVVNVRASEGAGTTTLLSTDNFHQVFNLSAARTVLLPSSGIVAGQKIRIENQGTGKLTLQSSGANQLCIIDSLYAYAEVTALQALPTSAAHWKVNFRYEEPFGYAHGTTYAGGIAPTITSTPVSGGAITVIHSSFMPYQHSNGIWRLRGSFTVTYGTQQSTSADQTMTINGVTFTALASNSRQPGIGDIRDSGAGSSSLMRYVYANPNSSDIIWRQNGTDGINRLTIWFDMSLETKPTWAY